MAQQPLAYLNAEFLESNDARPIRILSEYLEPLRRFHEQKIQDTVVFFGSARVDSRERAERALKTLRARGVRNADEKYQIDLQKSGTRKEELLILKKDLDRIWVLRRVLSPLSSVEQMELVIERLSKTKSNAEFLSSMNQ